VGKAASQRYDKKKEKSDNHHKTEQGMAKDQPRKGIGQKKRPVAVWEGGASHEKEVFYVLGKESSTQERLRPAKRHAQYLYLAVLGGKTTERGHVFKGGPFSKPSRAS